MNTNLMSANILQNKEYYEKIFYDVIFFLHFLNEMQNWKVFCLFSNYLPISHYIVSGQKCDKCSSLITIF